MTPKLMSPGTHSSGIGKEAVNKIINNSQEGEECSRETDEARLLGGDDVTATHKNVQHGLVSIKPGGDEELSLGGAWRGAS